MNLMERIEYIGKEIVYKEEDGKCPIMDGRLWVCLFCRRKAVAERGQCEGGVLDSRRCGED